jgi:hypothetical protein
MKELFSAESSEYDGFTLRVFESGEDLSFSMGSRGALIAIKDETKLRVLLNERQDTRNKECVASFRLTSSDDLLLSVQCISGDPAFFRARISDTPWDKGGEEELILELADETSGIPTVIMPISDEIQFYNLLRDRNDARAMADIEAADFPRYLSSEEAWVVLRSPSKKNDEDLCSGVAINQSIPGRVVYDPGLYVESFENLELRNNSWCLLDGDDSSASNLVGKTFDRWTPPVVAAEEEPIAPVDKSEIVANFIKAVNDAPSQELQFLIDAITEVIAARGGV